jgi:autotransporter translocation and assembly factor TamB
MKKFLKVTVVVVILAGLAVAAYWASPYLMAGIKTEKPKGVGVTASVSTNTSDAPASTTTATAVASINATADVIAANANVSTTIDQSTRIYEERADLKLDTAVRQNIQMKGGQPAIIFEQGEADLKRAQGHAKLEEIRGKYPLRAASFRSYCPAIEPPTQNVNVKISVDGKIDVDGNVGMSGNVTQTGNITHNGNVTTSGNVKLDGNVNMNGNVRVDGKVGVDGKVTGSITVDGKTLRVYWDPCSKQWIQYN